MNAVIAVTGKDATGIVAKVSTKCAEYGANITDISQTVLDGYFTMIMIVDIGGLTIEFSDFIDAMTELGKKSGLIITTMHEQIFNTMHEI
ncbi:MAG: ACT domain-containing protein [Clostridia bacterium]|nr:ACT domain-containing protein [Clostridia bacterium]